MSDDLILLPDDVAEIVAILDGTPYDRLDIKTRRFTLRVARSSSGWTQSWEHRCSEIDAVPHDEPAVSTQALDEPAEADGTGLIRAPLPGTFYHAPQPGAPPFAKLGDRLAPDNVIGIIETMKVMNSVAAGIAGELTEIIAANGAQVGPDAPLMRVRMQP